MGEESARSIAERDVRLRHLEKVAGMDLVSEQTSDLDARRRRYRLKNMDE